MSALNAKTPEQPLCLRPDNNSGWRDISVLLPAGFTLASGERLSNRELRLRLYGDPENPLVIALGGISSGRRIADSDDGKGWWRGIVSAGGASGGVDLEKFCVLGFDFLPNREETARTITTVDQARALCVALDYLDIARIHGFAGASYGGMVALAFAARYPARATKLCIISAADRANPAATAVRGVQRRILQFAKSCGKPEEGVALARQLAMTTYRTPEEFGERFDSAPGAGGCAAAGDPYDVCDYLMARGNAFPMSADRFLTLSDSIDRHRIDPAARFKHLHHCGIAWGF